MAPSAKPRRRPLSSATRAGPSGPWSWKPRKRLMWQTKISICRVSLMTCPRQLPRRLSLLLLSRLKRLSPRSQSSSKSKMPRRHLLSPKPYLQRLPHRRSRPSSSSWTLSTPAMTVLFCRAATPLCLTPQSLPGSRKWGRPPPLSCLPGWMCSAKSSIGCLKTPRPSFSCSARRAIASWRVQTNSWQRIRGSP